MVNYQLVALAVGAVAGTGGAILLWSGLRNYRQGTAIGGASSLGEQLGTGSLATVEGTIADAIGGETLDSALGGAPCVAYSSRKVTRRARDQRDIPRAGVNGADVREWFGPVHDGRQDWDVRVEASDAHVAVANEDYEHVSTAQVVENKGLLYGVLRFLVTALIATDEKREREYLEACFRPGDVARAVGVLDRTDSGGGATLIGRRGTPLVITSLSVGSRGSLSIERDGPGALERRRCGHRWSRRRHRDGFGLDRFPWRRKRHGHTRCGG
jgi:hypothetical protein